MNQAQDGLGGTESDDSLARLEKSYVPVVGQTYYDMLSDEKLAEDCLSNADPNLRSLALALIMRRRDVPTELESRFRDLIEHDANTLVRAQAVIALSKSWLRRSTRPLDVFARIALDEGEQDLVRKAAYQSAVLCQADYMRTTHIRDYMLHKSRVCDFDVEYLNSLLLSGAEQVEGQGAEPR